MSEYFEDPRICVQGYSWYLLAYHYQSNSFRGLQSFLTFNSFFAVWVVGIPTTEGFYLQLKSLNVAAGPLIEHMVKFKKISFPQTSLFGILSNNIRWAYHYIFYSV